MKRKLCGGLTRALTGFAAGVMVAASVWSLLIPAMEQSGGMGAFAFIPAVTGLWAGILFLPALDLFIPCLGRCCGGGAAKKTSMLVLAVALHNVPEGMAVGVALTGWMTGRISAADALALALGIAIQNIPEGAIISMPLQSEGMKKGKAFLCGVLSGIVEPVGAALTILAAGLVIPALPFLLSFAAGAMLYVVVEELIPDMYGETHVHTGTFLFSAGFCLMMALDVALG